jgi:hypothetical protein
MSWSSSIFVGILTAIVGLLASTFVASLAVGWYRVPNFEAQSAAFVAGFAVLGFVVGLIIGIITSRTMGVPGAAGFFKTLGGANAMLLGLIAVVGITARLLADVPPKLDGETLMLAVEVRWPEGRAESPASISGEPTVTLGSVTRAGHVQRASSTGPLWTSDAHLVDGRWVAPGAVDIFTTRGRLVLSVRLDSATSFGFLLPLSGAPGRKDLGWTEWMPRPRPGAPPLPNGYTYRYRVQKRSEPVRTETVGPFDVQTIAHYFYNETVNGKTVLATSGRFAIRHRGQPVAVGGSGSDSAGANAASRLDRADGVAVIGGPQPALLVHFIDPNDSGPCVVLTEEAGSLRTIPVPDCSYANGSVLTSDTATFRQGERQVPRGHVNRLTFETPGLYSIGGSVIDTRRMAVHTYEFPEGFSIFPAVPPLGVSPDERSFVRFGSVWDGATNQSHTSIAVVDFVGHRSYVLPVDEARMRYAKLDVIDPVWLMHHFAWAKGSDGIDSLVERKGFVPIPYHGTLTEASGYWLEPAREGLRDAILDFLVKEYKGERVPVESYAYEYPVKIDGQVINVAYGSTGNYVAVSVPHGVTDRTLLETIAKRFDAELATGKYDALFGK